MTAFRILRFGSDDLPPVTCLHDAQVFARRWVIRDKDPALKALVRCLERARSAEMSASALRELRSALQSRGLLRQGGAQ